MSTITAAPPRRQDLVLRTVPGERFTPYTLARKLNASVLLESASFHRGRERYSILLLQPAFTVQERAGETIMIRDGSRFRLRSSGRDILDVLRYFADQHAGARHPFPFPAGGIGYLSYEYATRFDTVRLERKHDSLGLPDAWFVFGHVFVVFDHYTDSLTLLGVNYREHGIDLERALDDTERRINELVRESLVLLCGALEALGDRYAIYGFSGRTHRNCELYPIKRLDEPYGAAVRRRIGAAAPRDYTRMGVMIRHLTRLLADAEARTRLLIALSDGKPDDQDGYRGAYGIEDTRRALHEARHLGIHPYCITIDDEAMAYLPHMYGAANFAVVDRIERLPQKVSDIYRRIAA